MEEDNEGATVVITHVYGDVCLRKTRRKRQKALVREMFYDYATNTTLHGLPYTTKRGLTLIEKLFWVITFIASICLCCYLIHNVYIKWRTSPVIVTVSEKLIPVRTVPFPSVLICPQSKSKATVYNYTDEKIRLDGIAKFSAHRISLHEKDFAKFEDISTICGQFGANLESLEVLDRKYSDYSVAKHVYEVAPKRHDIFGYCMLWGRFDNGCKKTVSEILTSEGLCFIVNSLAFKDILRNDSMHKHMKFPAKKLAVNWTNEGGYTDYGLDAYPVPGKENGASPDLEIILRDKLVDRDQICNVVNSGYKVYIQHPADLPQSTLYYFGALNEEVTSMALSFNMVYTSEALRGYNPDIRQCYFPDERYLKYFKIYTANNCKIECLANVTFNMCNCVAFHMPHESKRICTYKSKECMDRARDEVVEMEAREQTRVCRCLPSCNSVEYEAEILKTDFNLKEFVKAVYKSRNLSDSNLNSTKVSKLELYFKKSRFVSMQRSELFGLTDFLANIGGLLGLFLGFSFLSFIELFYFATLRLWCTLKKDLKEEKIQRRNTIKIPQKH